MLAITSLHMEGQNPEPGIGMLVITLLHMEGKNLEPGTDAIVTESLSAVTLLQAFVRMAWQSYERGIFVHGKGNLELGTWKVATGGEPGSNATITESLFTVTSF